METHPGGVLNLSSSESRYWLSQGRIDGCVKIWDETELIDVVRTNSESFCRASVIWGEVDNYTLASTNQDEGVISVWESRNKAARTLLSPSQEQRWGMVMDVKLVRTPSHLYTVSVYEDGYLRTFDVTEQKIVPELCLQVQPDLSPSTALILSLPDSSEISKGIVGGASNQLASFTLDFSMHQSHFGSFFPAYHQSQTLDENASHQKYGHGVSQLALRNDNKIFAVASWDYRVRILHFRTCKHLAVLKHHRDSVHCVAFSNTDGYLASGSKDQNIAIWKIY